MERSITDLDKVNMLKIEDEFATNQVILNSI